MSLYNRFETGEMLSRISSQQKEGNRIAQLSQRQLELNSQAIERFNETQITGFTTVCNELLSASTSLEQNMNLLIKGQADISYGLNGLRGDIAAMSRLICGYLSQLALRLNTIISQLDELLFVAINPKKIEAQEYVKQGVRHFKIKEYDVAKSKFEKALEVDSTEFASLYWLGVVMLELENFDDALYYFIRACQLPDDVSKEVKANSYSKAARTAFAKEEFKDSIKWFTMAIDLFPHSEFYYYRSITSAVMSKADDALNDLAISISQNPLNFVRASSDPQFTNIRKEVDLMLGSLVQERKSNFARIVKEVKNLEEDLNRQGFTNYLGFVNHVNEVDEYLGYVLLEKQFELVKEDMNNLRTKNTKLKMKLLEMNDTVGVLETVRVNNGELNKKLANLDKEANRHSSIKDFFGPISPLVWGAAYFVNGLVIASHVMNHPSVPDDAEVFAVILFWIFFPVTSDMSGDLKLQVLYITIVTVAITLLLSVANRIYQNSEINRLRGHESALKKHVIDNNQKFNNYQSHKNKVDDETRMLDKEIEELFDAIEESCKKADTLFKDRWTNNCLKEFSLF